MAFVVTYHSLAKNNIRNLYGGLPEDIKLRQCSSQNALTTAQRIQEQYKRSAPTDRFLNDRYLEYDHENHIRIPRAPAFRQVSAPEMKNIVARLSQPTVCKRRRTSDICEREARRSLVESCRKCRLGSARSSVSEKKLAEITSRVCLPTVTTNVRNSLRMRSDYSAQEVREQCHKCPPSERFVREFSQYNI